MDEELTDKQAAFVNHYLQIWNATEAARRAGYKGDDATLASVGWENLRKPAIRTEIDKRLAEHKLSADEILARLSEFATASMGDFISKWGRGFRLDIKKAEERGKLHLIKKISKGRNGTTIELVDSLAALDRLAKYYKLYSDLSINVPPELGPTLSKLMDKVWSQE